MHGAKAAPSRLHWNVPGSVDEKVKVADVSVTEPDGPESMTVSGGVVSGGGPWVMDASSAWKHTPTGVLAVKASTSRFDDPGATGM